MISARTASRVMLLSSILLLIPAHGGRGQSSTGPATAPATQAQIQWGKEVEGFRLGIAFERKSYKAGEGVMVIIHLENQSTERKQLADVGPLKGFVFNISRENGATNETQYGKLYNGKDAFRPSGSTRNFVDPGAEITLQVYCNRVVDMSVDGVYTVVVKREVPSADGKKMTLAESGSFDVEVKDAK